MVRIFIKYATFVIACIFIASNAFGQSTGYDAFRVKVSGKGQPIILIPGATCGGDEWDATVAHLSGKYQCHVLTLAGYAGTPALPGGPYLETVRKQISQYIRDNHLENVILIGHSIGGFLSLCLGSEMKDHLQKILVVDAMPFFAGAQNPNAPDTFSETQAKKMLAMYNNMDNKALKAYQYNTAKFLCRDSTYWDKIAEWGAHSDRKTMAYTLTEMLGNDIRKRISSIKVPVLVLGAFCKMPQYPGFTRESVVSAFSDQYKACTSCTVHITDNKARHFIMFDAPEWYFAELDTFLK